MKIQAITEESDRSSSEEELERVEAKENEEANLSLKKEA